jgi:hypothetical protein
MDIIIINDPNLSDVHFVFKVHIISQKYFFIDHTKIDKIFVIFQLLINDFY